jgi:hypothetical protein
MSTEPVIPVGFTIQKRCDGIIQKMGKSAGIEANWYYETRDLSGNECILMYCRPGNYTIIDKNSLQQIREVEGRKVTWFIMKNGYVAGHIMSEGILRPLNIENGHRRVSIFKILRAAANETLKTGTFSARF